MNKLLNIDEILNINNEVDHYIYFLIKDKQVVYIGRSKNIHLRIATHVKISSYDFDSFKFIRVSKSEVSELEKRYIRRYQPLYNVNVKNYRAYIRKADRN